MMKIPSELIAMFVMAVMESISWQVASSWIKIWIIIRVVRSHLRIIIPVSFICFRVKEVRDRTIFVNEITTEDGKYD